MIPARRWVSRAPAAKLLLLLPPLERGFRLARFTAGIGDGCEHGLRFGCANLFDACTARNRRSVSPTMPNEGVAEPLRVELVHHFAGAVVHFGVVRIDRDAQRRQCGCPVANGSFDAFSRTLKVSEPKVFYQVLDLLLVGEDVLHGTVEVLRAAVAGGREHLHSGIADRGIGCGQIVPRFHKFLGFGRGLVLAEREIPNGHGFFCPRGRGTPAVGEDA